MHQLSCWRCPGPSNNYPPPALCTAANYAWASGAKEMFMLLHSKQAQTWTSSSPHLQQSWGPQHLPMGVKGSEARPSPAAHPAQAGGAGVQIDASVGAVCAPKEGCLVLCRPWLSFFQPSSQLGGILKAPSLTSILFTIIFQRVGWQFCTRQSSLGTTNMGKTLSLPFFQQYN